MGRIFCVHIDTIDLLAGNQFKRDLFRFCTGYVFARCFAQIYAKINSFVRHVCKTGEPRINNDS